MMLLLGFQASQQTAQANLWQIINNTNSTTFGQWVFQGPDVVGVDFSTPQIVGVGRDVIKLQIIVTLGGTSNNAYGVLRYAFV